MRLGSNTQKYEVNPKVWTKNFGVYFMHKKHDYSALLKYMHMLEDGYSINYIHTKYGIGHSQLEKLWMLYQEYGAIPNSLPINFLLISPTFWGQITKAAIIVSFPAPEIETGVYFQNTEFVCHVQRLFVVAVCVRFI